MNIPNEIIDRVREASRIEDIVQKYVPTLKKKGSNYLGLCPFHREKTPSFTVSAEKQIFHCFGCSTGGNVFSFISKIERLSFPETVRFLAKRAGIEIDGETKDPNAPYYQINDFAMRLYASYLLSDDGTTGLSYVLERGVTEESVKTFRLGYAPDSWDFLKNALRRKHADPVKAAELALLARKERPDGVHYYDFFRGRVMFPIFDRSGRVAGFGGRIIGSGEPKYLNSPESPIYRKRDILYGYEQAKAEIAHVRRAVIVEGYLDVIGCHQVGICNVVAPLGTALTPEQVRLLARSVEEIILLFDADSAGLRASLRSISIMREFNIAVRVASLPEEDPFDFAVSRGARELLAVIDSAMDADDFRLSVAARDIPVKGVRSVMFSIFEDVRELPLETDKDAYLKKAAKVLETDFFSLKADFRRFEAGNTVPEKGSRPKSTPAEEFIDTCYRELCVLLINNSSLIGKAALDFAEYKPESLYGRIYARLVEIYSDMPDISISSIFDAFTEEDERKFLEENIVAENPAEDPDRCYNEIYVSLRIHLIDGKITFYAALASRNPTADTLLELENWKREKDKFVTYLEGIRGVGPRKAGISFW